MLNKIISWLKEKYNEEFNNIDSLSKDMENHIKENTEKRDFRKEKELYRKGHYPYRKRTLQSIACFFQELMTDPRNLLRVQMP